MSELKRISEQLVRMYPEVYDVIHIRVWAYKTSVKYAKCMHVLRRRNRNLGISDHKAGTLNIATVHYYLNHERAYVSLELIDMRHKHNKDSK